MKNFIKLTKNDFLKKGTFVKHKNKIAGSSYNVIFLEDFDSTSTIKFKFVWVNNFIKFYIEPGNEFLEYYVLK